MATAKRAEVAVRSREEIAAMFRAAVLEDKDLSEAWDTEQVQRQLAGTILEADDEEAVFGSASLPALSDLIDQPIEIQAVHFNPTQVEKGPKIYAVAKILNLATGEVELRHVGGYRPVAQLLWLWERDKFPYRCKLTEVAKGRSGQNAPLGFVRVTAQNSG